MTNDQPSTQINKQPNNQTKADTSMAQYFVRSSFCPDILLLPGKKVVLGRGPLTTIKDSRVSRQQMTVEWSGGEVVVRQVGHNHSMVAGEPLAAGEWRVMQPAESLDMLEGQYQFKLVEDKSNMNSNEENERKNVETTNIAKRSSKPSSNHWSQGLLSSMEDPDLLVTSNTDLVTIKDKYPKACHHYLVLPKKQLPNLQCLTKDDLDLLNMMDSEAARLTASHPSYQFQVGYHAVPSMAQVHLHVVSRDFDSPCLKHKKHWNSFTTPYFVPSTLVISQLEENGKIDKPDKDLSKQWLDTPLKCHKCDYTPKNFPDLKQHIKNH
eukprot:GFUD01043805.1.p1 GENE.GFUD01043805.1~~GFUD01043805.1.p1  ORF type:complete len:323 (+),score=116.23 GFUD01043805.1:60-1028(+)